MSEIDQSNQTILESSDIILNTLACDVACTDLPTSNSNESGDLIESFLRSTLNSGDKILKIWGNSG
jgi:hypothetical protein